MSVRDRDFVHLHLHTDYSLLDGACQMERVMGRVSGLGMEAVAITDHGNLFGAIDFFGCAKKYEIKPLLGCEIYLVTHDRAEKPDRSRHKYYHMGLIARDYEGYRNLSKICTDAHLNGYHYRPRTDPEQLARHAKGLIGFTGCLQGIVPQYLLAGNYAEARRWVGRFVDLFGKDHYFVELQDHDLPEQSRIAPDLIRLAEEFDLKMVCTNDVHYVEKNDSGSHDVLLCIQTASRVSDESRMRYPNDNFYLKSPREMESIFGERPDLLTNTSAVAEMCEVKLPFDQNHFPVFEPPRDNGKTWQNHTEYLRHLSISGLQKRYGIDYHSPARAADPARAREIIERMEYELATIEKTGFVDYYLIVQDFMNWAIEQRIPVGPGRGSGAGSIVAYLTNITGIDPMRFGLLFERMLNPERVSPPDFDLDFCMRRRGEVVDFVREKYGVDCVANIITFGRFGAKMVIRDVARVLDISYPEADRIAKMVPDELNTTLSSALEKSRELQDEVKTNPLAAEIVHHGKIIEGLVRNTGTHAAGLIIGDGPLKEHLPLTRQEGALTTQYAKDPVEKLGLLKIDFLGLKTLTVIADAVAHIRRTAQPGFDIEAISLDDEEAFTLLNEARTVGVFQMESSGMRSLCRQFGITEFEEIIALIALYRPGPMAWIQDYVRGKHDPASIVFPHPLLENVARETYGVMVYQEQVMEAARVIAGFTLSEADVLRVAMGKKLPEVMAKQRETFVKGAAKTNGIERKVALEIFAILEKFAGYGFPKAHSAAYAMLTYQTAYLKANFPVQFMAAVLSSELGNSDKVSHFIHECAALKIPVLGPDINQSRGNFTPVLEAEGSASGLEGIPSRREAGRIRFGLAAVKGVGDAAAREIIEQREAGGEYQDFREFAHRVDTRTVNRRVSECLIKAGVFDSSSVDRGILLAQLDAVLRGALIIQRDRERGQKSFFDLLDVEDPIQAAPAHAQSGNGPPAAVQSDSTMPLQEKLRLEKELLGFYISGHPMNRFRGLDGAIDTLGDADLSNLPDRAPFRTCGVITHIGKKISRRDNRPWAILQLGTRKSTVSINVFAETYSKSQNALKEGNLVLLGGTVLNRNGDLRFSAESVRSLERALPSIIERVEWVLHSNEEADDFLREIAKLAQENHGSTDLRIGFLLDGKHILTADIAESLNWRICPDTFQRLRSHPSVVGARITAKGS